MQEKKWRRRLKKLSELFACILDRCMVLLLLGQCGSETLSKDAWTRYMGTISARARRVIFIAGLALIAFGGIGLVIHAPWGDVANSLFTIFGTTTSFAQFSIGFVSLKPADGS